MNSSYEKLWTQVLDAIMAAGVFEQDTFSWLKKTTLFKIDESEAYVAYRSIVSYNLLNNNQELFADSLSELWGKELSLVIVSYKDMEQLLPEVVVEQRTNNLLEFKFNEGYTFESFVEGSSNQEAYAACLAVCTGKPGGMFNPLMLFGNSGLGKTHLLHAVGNYLHKEKPESRVLYMYSGDFVSLLIEAMKTKNVHGNTVERVKEQLLDCDYFLIDDIQNLQHASSQEIFFTVYNKLLQQNSQIILTSDIHPQELSGLQARLVSRFKSGLAINISKPGFETSKAILKKKIEGRQEACQIEEDVVDFLALRFSNDVRNLEGSLNRLIFNATLFNPPVINMEFASQVLETETIIESDTADLNVKEIKKAVTRYYGLAYKDLEGKSRQKKIMTARHLCVWLCRELLHKPYTVIGVELGGRDHKTIASSYERACLLMKKEPSFLEAAEDLQSRLGDKRK
ncbi:chromosomal replication initiator protein DnaA [Ileibacterium valens]|uniref:chromosomal replication initiator protein DnaA n=1 Tax=Ileibacterium valens TaxID=1862668 RepID=UPI002573E0D9|nr:chromosomal replication initiator protein DnaA [Ileibacterium valens]